MVVWRPLTSIDGSQNARINTAVAPTAQGRKRRITGRPVTPLHGEVTKAIDLRSDTVTWPTDAMRAARACAPVGDHQYGEGPSTNRLQARRAELRGKQAAQWQPTGAMAKQVALRTLTQPGDEVVASRESHAAWHEVGGAAANAGAQIHETGQGGLFTADALRAATQPRHFAISPSTTLVEIENTHHRAGGVVGPQHSVLELCAVARALGLTTLHGQCRGPLDGRTATRLR